MGGQSIPEMVLGGLIAVVLLLFLFILANNSGKTRDDRKKRKELLRLRNKAATESVKEANVVKAEVMDPKIPPDLIRFDCEMQKVLELVGIADSFDSTVVLEDIIEGKFKAAALAIASKLSFKHPIIYITKQSQEKIDDNGSIVVAEVKVSGQEPVFGTREFNYQTISINVYPEVSDYLDKFIFVIAHELCHKVLHSLDRRKEDKQDERETDIAAALLGFYGNLKRAKKHSRNLGYLSVEEADYLAQRCDGLLKAIHANIGKYYKEYVLLRQRNEDKVLFLDNLYKAKRLVDGDDYSLDYSILGEDYSRLVVCTNSIRYQDLREYHRLANYFSLMNKERDRYSSDLLRAEEKMARLINILEEVSIPDFDSITILKKYQQ